MFKKGDYIVCLNTPEDNEDFPPNYIFKQRQNAENIKVEKDNKGISNGWGLIDFNQTKRFSNWRYGTKEEIIEYEKLDKPYDTTTLMCSMNDINENYDYLIPILNKLLK
jgi:hypothetical protein